MKNYDDLIKNTIRSKNTYIYRDLLEFLCPARMGAGFRKEDSNMMHL